MFDLFAVCAQMKVAYTLLFVLLSQWILQEIAGSVLPVPVAIYPLNINYTVSDGSCYSNQASKQVGVHLTTGPYNKPWAAYEFTGVPQSYIEIPASQRLDTRYSITILTWIFHSGLSSGPIFSYVENNGLGLQLWVTRRSTLFARLMARDGHPNSMLILESDKVNLTGSWHYVGLSFDYSSRRAKLWIDGQSFQETITVGELQLKTAGLVRVGSISPRHVRHFKGRISCMQVYNRALTQSDVQAVKDRCFRDGVDLVNCMTIASSGSCGDHLAKKSGTFHSPGFPSGYPADTKCVWTIQTKSEWTVKLKFKVFSLEDNPLECGDYVEIRDGLGSWDIPLKKYCGGSGVSNDWIQATGNAMRVEFVTDSYVGGLGFMAEYTSSAEVEGRLDLGVHYTGIVIGVACAALFTVLTMLVVSHTRRWWRMRQSQLRPHDLSSESGLDTADAIQDGAPPSYIDVMRSPELYPPSPRVTPANSRCGTPLLTPKFGPRAGIAMTSHVSIATTISSPRHSQWAITGDNRGSDEDPPPAYPGIIVNPLGYARQSSVPVAVSYSTRGRSPLSYSGVRPKSHGDLAGSVDRYSRRLGQSSSSLGNTRDNIRHPSSFCRRPSPLVGSRHQHSSRSLPRCTAGAGPLAASGQARSICSNHSQQLSDSCFRAELRDSDLQLSVTDSEGSHRSDQHSEHIQFDDSEFAQELRQVSRNSSLSDVYFDEDPPPYPGSETQSGCGSVTQLENPVTELSSSRVLLQTVETDEMVSHDHIETSEEHSTESVVDNGQTSELLGQTRALLESERSETCRSDQSAVPNHEDQPTVESPLVENLQTHQHNIEHGSQQHLNKDCARIDSTTGHEKESDNFESPWQRRLSFGRRRGRARGRETAQRPDNFTSTGSHVAKDHSEVTEENPGLGGDAIIGC